MLKTKTIHQYPYAKDVHKIVKFLTLANRITIIKACPLCYMSSFFSYGTNYSAYCNTCLVWHKPVDLLVYGGVSRMDKQTFKIESVSPTTQYFEVLKTLPLRYNGESMPRLPHTQISPVTWIRTYNDLSIKELFELDTLLKEEEEKPEDSAREVADRLNGRWGLTD